MTCAAGGGIVTLDPDVTGQARAHTTEEVAPMLVGNIYAFAAAPAAGASAAPRVRAAAPSVAHRLHRERSR